jgi:hypothetical protein
VPILLSGFNEIWSFSTDCWKIQQQTSRQHVRWDRLTDGAKETRHFALHASKHFVTVLWNLVHELLTKSCQVGVTDSHALHKGPENT